MSASAQASSERGGEMSLKLHRFLVGAEVGAAGAENDRTSHRSPSTRCRVGAAGATRDIWVLLFSYEFKTNGIKEPWLPDQRQSGPSNSKARACPPGPSPSQAAAAPWVLTELPPAPRSPCSIPPARSHGRAPTWGLHPFASAAARLCSWEKASGELERKRTSRKPL